jgi:hypothetical protein
LMIVCIFSLSISQAPGPLVKTGAASLLMLALLMPVTRQFFLPVLPIFTWLLFFFNARYVAEFLSLSTKFGIGAAIWQMIDKYFIADSRAQRLQH